MHVEWGTHNMKIRQDINAMLKEIMSLARNLSFKKMHLLQIQSTCSLTMVSYKYFIPAFYIKTFQESIPTFVGCNGGRGV